MPKLKTVKNWKKEYDIKLEWDVKASGNAENIRCLTCKDNDGRLQGLKNNYPHLEINVKRVEAGLFGCKNCDALFRP